MVLPTAYRRSIVRGSLTVAVVMSALGLYHDRFGVFLFAAVGSMFLFFVDALVDVYERLDALESREENAPRVRIRLVPPNDGRGRPN